MSHPNLGPVQFLCSCSWETRRAVGMVRLMSGISRVRMYERA